MRKRVVQGVQTSTGDTLQDWSLLPIETIAEVEVSSEGPNAPIDAALSCVAGSGWRAGVPGEQRVAILFDQPERVRRIVLKFVEAERPRTQEFVLTWSSQVGTPAHLIVRQQWTFSPEASTTEQETYEVTLDNVGVLELLIKPDLSDHTVFATLAEWRIFGER
jgi:hypothetical protein